MPRTKPESERLSQVMQLRLTERQYGWLRQIADETGRPVSAIVRDVVTVWAVNRLREDGVRIDVAAAVRELEELGDSE